MKQRLVLIQSMNSSPCQNCEDRHSGCHSECDAYILFRKRCDKVAEEKEKDRLGSPEPSRRMIQYMRKKSLGR